MDNPHSDYSGLPADFENTPEEIELIENIDWFRRLWPKADRFEDAEGEWSLTVKGTDEDFLDVHRLLSRHGWCVEDASESYIKDPDFQEEE